jgi:hypothetical protein
LFSQLMATSRASLISSLGSTAPFTMVSASCIPTYIGGAGSTAGPRQLLVTDGPASSPFMTYMNVNTSGNSTDGGVYIDNTCKHQLDVVGGSTYNFTVRTGPNVERWRVFVDYNNDGIFQTTEEIQNHTGTIGNESYTFQYTVPTTATIPTLQSCTPLRMRVISDRVIAPAIDVNGCGSLTYGQAEDYSIRITGGGPSVGAVSIALTSGTNPSCFNSPLTFTATPGTGITATGYLWYVNGVSTGITTNPYTSSTLGNNDIVSVKMYFVGACGTDSSTSVGYTVLRQATVAPTVSIALTSGTNPGCPGQLLTFTATPTNGGTAPTYQWYVNGTAVTGATNPSFSSVLANNSVVAVTMVSNSSCASPISAISNPITVTHVLTAPSVTIALTSGTNPGCPGQQLTFTATNTTGGTTPTFQWKVNGTAVTGATGTTFTSILNNNDVVTVDMISNDPCASPTNATSNSITITHVTITQDVTITLSAGSNPSCSGKPVSFTASTVNSGTNPGFQWFVNGIAVAGATTPNFLTTTLGNNAVVTAVVTSSDPCVGNTTDTSNSILMTINPTLTVNVSVALTAGSNPGCLDSLVEYTATVTNHGTGNIMEWLVNGNVVATGLVYSSTSLLNGDIVSFRSIAIDGGCYTQDTFTTPGIVMARFSTPSAPIISLIGNMLVANITGNLVWFGPSGMITGTSGQTYHPVQAGNYYAVANNNGCYSPPSNILNISLLTIGDYNLSQVKIFPNPTSGLLTLDWGMQSVNVKLDVYNLNGQGLLHEEVRNQSRKVVNLSNFANGTYFVVIRDENGKAGTIKISVMK